MLKEYFLVKMISSISRFESYMTSNCYVVVPDSSSSVCYLVDLPPDYQQAINYVSEHNLAIGGVLLTHGHLDHTLGINSYNEKNIYINLEDQFLARNPKEQLKGLLLEDSINLESYSGELHDIFNIKVEGLNIYKNPGHTKGSISLHFDDLGAVFTGDFVFADGIGRTDLFSGNLKEMKDSLNNVFMKFENQLNIFPGHGKSDSVKNILKYNRYLWEIIDD